MISFCRVFLLLQQICDELSSSGDPSQAAHFFQLRTIPFLVFIFLFFYVSMGFNRTSLLLCLYPRHIKTVSESPKCWRNPALFYGPVMMFPEREIKNYRFVGSLLHQGTLLSVIHNKRLNQSRWI